MDLQNFFKLFFADDEVINIRLIKEDNKSKPTTKTGYTYLNDLTFRDAYTDKVFNPSSYNKKGYGVFFVPNSGGFKGNEIEHINSYFIDVDFAKENLGTFETKEDAFETAKRLQDTNKFAETISDKTQGGKYNLKGILHQRLIKQHKRAFLDKFEGDLNKVSAIIETFSGFHIYFALLTTEQKNDFKYIQKGLSNYFGSDAQVNNPNRLMRVPYFEHKKYSKNSNIEIYSLQNKKWTKEELVKTFIPETKGIQHERKLEKTVDNKKGMKTEKTFTPTHIVWKNPYKKRDIKQKLPLNEFLDYVKSLPFSTFIEDWNDDENVLCPFHADTRPSASVFESENGEMVFNCFACSVKPKNIISFYQKSEGLSLKKTIEIFQGMVGIKIEESEFTMEQIEKYRINNRFLTNIVDHPSFKESEELQNVLTPKRIDLLRHLRDLADAVLQENLRVDDESIFYVSIRELNRKFQKSSFRETYENLKILLLLGFIERVPFEKIPKKYQERSKQEKEKLKKEFQQQGIYKSDINEINYYKMHYFDDVIDDAVEIAEIIQEKQLSPKNLNKNDLTIFFGSDIASRVFPDNRKADKQLILYEKMRPIIQQQLDEQGFIVCENLAKYKFVKKMGKYYTQKELLDYIKRMMQIIIKDFELQRKMVRKKSKQRTFGYEGNLKTINILYRENP